MARFFTEAKIEEFRECFVFHERRGFITQEGNLSIIMRSLDFSPTREEVTKYFKKHSSGGQIDFEAFLSIIHEHSQVENCRKELQAALEAQDRTRSGYVNASDIRQILTSMGEKLSRNEVDTIFKNSGISPTGQVKISEFVQSVMTPSPDY